ncbi:MAG: SnoaL-like domain-containing protein [Pleurocapsa sp. SU_196_0]|nr:SnoaL-like domain-containing protein [Pleurocapsa sp. SU_196_0]
MKNALKVVQGQLEAYNARDLKAFLEFFSDEVRVFRPPASEPSLMGKAQLEVFYATQRFNLLGLHAELLSRIVLGNKVFDHERIHGVQVEPFELVVIYEVQAERIQTVWTFAPT